MKTKYFRKDILKCAKASPLLLSLLFLVGCATVGPDYQEPMTELKPAWEGMETPTLESDPPFSRKWWHAAFNDPVLDRLVETALAQNLSLQSAALRVLQSRQKLAIAIGNQYPQQQQLNGNAGVEYTDSTTTDMYSLGFNLGWEIDFWGRYRLSVDSAEASLDASVADYDGVMITLLADVAQNYLLIRTFETRWLVADYNIRLQEESLRITQAKFDAGAVSALDVNQAETLLYNTKAQAVALEQSLQQTRNTLAILLGQPPHDMRAMLVENRPIPTVPVQIAVGMPQELIRRRPDLRAAERRLASQSAQIGVAVSELYPHFFIGGNIGTSSVDGVDDLFTSAGSALNLFGMFEWNVFNYGRLKGNIRLQDAVFQQQLVDYRNKVLQSQGEVENAIVAYIKSQEQLIDYQAAAGAAQRAVDVSAAQYEDGLVNFNTVITVMNSLRQQQDLLAATQGTVATNLVQVYKSLGGGWQIREDQAPDMMLHESTKEEMRERTKYWNKVFEEEQSDQDKNDT